MDRLSLSTVTVLCYGERLVRSRTEMNAFALVASEMAFERSSRTNAPCKSKLFRCAQQLWRTVHLGSGANTPFLKERLLGLRI